MTTDPMLLFSREEYARRLEAVRGEMRERGADVVVVECTCPRWDSPSARPCWWPRAEPSG